MYVKPKTRSSISKTQLSKKENFKPYRRQRETTVVPSLEKYMKEQSQEQKEQNHLNLKIPRSKRSKTLNIGTWNVRSLYESGKLANTIMEMKKTDTDDFGQIMDNSIQKEPKYSLLETIRVDTGKE
jgi:hypothetical protein